MVPALEPGQTVISFNWAYLFSPPKPGDLVAIKLQGTFLVKRVGKVSQGLIFVTGDNKKQSVDSRSFGWVTNDRVAGKVVLVFP